MDKHRGDFNLLGECSPIGQDFSTFECVDLSFSSCALSFLSPCHIDAQTEINLTIEISDNAPIRLKARVIASQSQENSGKYLITGRVSRSSRPELERFAQWYGREMIFGLLCRCILIVDDEHDINRAISLRLRQAGYEVVSAYDGEEGYAFYKKHHPDLIILDWMLPLQNGVEVCRKIRREEGDMNIPILMLTAKGEDADRIVGKVVGAERYMTKPFDMDILLSEVAQMLTVSRCVNGEGAG